MNDETREFAVSSRCVRAEVTFSKSVSIIAKQIDFFFNTIKIRYLSSPPPVSVHSGKENTKKKKKLTHIRVSIFICVIYHFPPKTRYKYARIAHGGRIGIDRNGRRRTRSYRRIVRKTDVDPCRDRYYVCGSFVKFRGDKSERNCRVCGLFSSRLKRRSELKKFLKIIKIFFVVFFLFSSLS